MSIKQNVEHIKTELSNEEKFLESFVKVERFYKKYKNLLLVSVVVIVVAVAGISINNYLGAANKTAANEAFSTLLEDMNNSQAMEILKDKNPKLAQIIEAKKAKIEGKSVSIDVQYLKELELYNEAIKNQDAEKLSQVLMQNDFTLKEYALFQKALILAQRENYKEAKEILEQIPQDSQVQQLASTLKHFLLTK